MEAAVLGSPLGEPAWDQLSEDDLLAVIGTAFVSPWQSFAATARAYGHGDIVERLGAVQPFGEPDVALVALGRRAVGETIDRMDDAVRREICRILRSGVGRSEMLASLLTILAGCVLFHGVPLIAIAYVLIRDGGKRLCEGYEKQIKTVKVYRF
jgi:hypothetical protein